MKKATQDRPDHLTAPPLYFYDPYTEARIPDIKLRSCLNELSRVTQGLTGLLRLLEANATGEALDGKRPFPDWLEGSLYSAAIALVDHAHSKTDQVAGIVTNLSR